MSIKSTVLFLGPILGILAYILLSGSISEQGALCGGLITFTICWWVFEVLPLPVTGLFSVAIAGLLRLASAKELFASFANPVIFLFLGGFFLAEAMCCQNLDKRIALKLLSLRFVGGRPLRSLMAVLIITASLSMWLSNSATTAMMLPLSMGILTALGIDDEKLRSYFLISVAYASSLGGLCTPVGSPPNAITMSMLKSYVGIEISFLQWMKLGIPLFVIGFAALFYLVLPGFKPINNDKVDQLFLQKELRKMPALNSKEKWTLAIGGFMILLWVGPDLSSLVLGEGNSKVVSIRGLLPPSIAAIIASSMLFIFPIHLKGMNHGILTWADAKRIDWGSLLLFGSGISLGHLMFSTGLAQSLGDFLITDSECGQGSVFSLVMIFILATVFLTNISSNTATANIMVPMAIGACQKLSLENYNLIILLGMACNMAFILPIATPPNTLVFGSGMVRMRDMVVLGLKLNLITLFLLMLAARLLLLD